MKISCLIILLQFGSYVCPSMAAERRPDSVVRKLYKEIVKRRPLGIPQGADKAAIWPLLSKRLIERLETGRACEADYFRQFPPDSGKRESQLPPEIHKPEFGWLESGVFSGENELVSPSAAVVERTSQQKDGSFRVVVRLTYEEPEPYKLSKPFQWHVAARVISERGRFVVDDVEYLEEEWNELGARGPMPSFSGCDGSRWTGLPIRD
jgi:hypothetical protein